MEKKYYDLIIKLIKEHRKYPDYEAILEDIANDVYEHSKVVINSVTNEEVIAAYLNKVISTSMITVPKKMNFNTRVRHRAISPAPVEEILSSVIIPSETSSIESVEEQSLAVQEVTEELEDVQSLTEQEVVLEEQISELELEEEIEEKVVEFDSIEEFVEEEVVESIEKEDDSLTLVEDSEIQESIIEVVEQESCEDLTVTAIDEVVSLPDEETNDCPENFDKEDNSSIMEEVDKNLVDKMINGISSDNNNNASNFEEEDVLLENQEIEEEVLEIYETLEEVEPLEQSESSELELAENIVEDSISEEVVDEQFENVEESIVEPIENTIEDIQEDGLIELNDNVLELDVEENSVEQEFLMEVEPVELSNAEEFIGDTLIEQEGEVVSIENNETLDATFVPPSYDCFNFNPENPEYDYEEIYSELSDHDEKHPERNILKICDLKYNKKMSIGEIAENVNFTEEEVLDVLSEIIDIVKD